MKIQQIFFNNNLRNFCYLLVFDSDYTICIDPFHHDLVIQEIGLGKLDLIINTHDHCDHHSGNVELIKRYKTAVGCHYLANISEAKYKYRHLENIYTEGEWSLIALDTPGHTQSHISILLKKNECDYAIFSGDTFFNAGVGNCYNGGNVEQLFQSIDKYYKTLGDDVLVFPGHEYLKKNLEFTLSIDNNNLEAKKYLNQIEKANLDNEHFVHTMKFEREINNFLRLNEKNVQVGLGFQSKASSVEVFKKLRALRDKW